MQKFRVAQFNFSETLVQSFWQWFFFFRKNKFTSFLSLRAQSYEEIVNVKKKVFILKWNLSQRSQNELSGKTYELS